MKIGEARKSSRDRVREQGYLVMRGLRMTGMKSVLRRVWRPMASRKVRVALAAVIAAFAAELGMKVGDDLVFTILGVGAALILGIAHEDAGRYSAGSGSPAANRGHDGGRDLSR